MKKFFAFFSLVLTLLLVFACDLQLPKAIQIKGTPELKFAANWEFDIFSDMMESAFGGDADIKECINAPQYKTFLFRMEIYEGNFKIGDDDVIDIDESYTMKTKKVLASSDNTPKKLPFSGFGDYLDGFKLKITNNVKSKLYVGGSEIVTAITIKLTGDGDDIDISSQKVTKSIVLPDNVHNLQELPSGGIDVNLPANFFDNGEGLDIGYEIYLAENEVIETDWLGKDYSLKAEIVIWIPMVLEAEKNNAEIKLDSFESVGGFFTSMSESGFIESLNIAVGMNVNPFKEGELVIRDVNSKNFEIKNPMSANALDFALIEEDVEYINEHDFDPEFSIRFQRGAEIKIPKVFSVTTVSLTAKLNYTVELGDM